MHSTTVVCLTVESALGQNGDYILTVCAVCQHLNGGMEKYSNKNNYRKILIDARLRFTLHSQSSVYT